MAVRYRVYGLSGCLGEFAAYDFEACKEGKSSLLAWGALSVTPVVIYYQEPILFIKDDHGRTRYSEPLGMEADL